MMIKDERYFDSVFKIEHIEELIDDVKLDLAKTYDKNNNAAKIRLRKSIRGIKSLLDEIGKDAQEFIKE